MSNRKPQNIDGFVLRRRIQGERSPHRLGAGPLIVPDKFLHNSEAKEVKDAQEKAPAIAPMALGSSANAASLKRSEIDEALSDIDDTPPKDLKRKRRLFSRKNIKWFFISIGAILLLIGGYLGVKFLIASGNVFNGNLFDLLGTGKELKTDQYGRTNILLFGNSEDSQSHIESGDGPELTDSIMVVSVDQKTKNAVMFSVPRDLWVKYGEACISGYEGRINEVYMCGKDGASQEQGARKLMDTVGESFGIDIQYYAQVNYTALKDAVNAVGGITVEIDSDDPRGVYDPNFDWQCGYQCNLVRWPNGPAKLNGEQALALARARNAAGGYGLGGSNFDREQNQQKIIIALKEKATEAGTLTNPVAISGLIDSLGNNVRTNFDTAEIKTVIGLVNDIKPESIRQVSLVDEEHWILTTDSINGASIVRPIAGLYDFSEVQRFVRSHLSSDISTEENASIAVLNGTDRVGVAGAKAEELTGQGLLISITGDAPTSTSYGALQWFDQSSSDMPQTKKKLQEVLGEADSGSTLPPGVQSEADFVIIVGNGVN